MKFSYNICKAESRSPDGASSFDFMEIIEHNVSEARILEIQALFKAAVQCESALSNFNMANRPISTKAHKVILFANKEEREFLEKYWELESSLEKEFRAKTNSKKSFRDVSNQYRSYKIVPYINLLDFASDELQS